MVSKDPLLQPFKLKNITLKNRIVSTPHAPAYVTPDSMPGERYQRYHEEKAKGGLSMTMFGGSSNIAPDSPSVFGQIYAGHDRIIPYFQEFSERIHQYDCALICQVTHMGRRTTWQMADWLPVPAPSRVREPAHRGFPKEMDIHDIKRIIKSYGEGARRCREGNLDGIELLHHGHLPDQFFSPLTNHRTDDYGGSFENRLRFTLETLEEMRRQIGDEKILGIRITGQEKNPAGNQVEECVRAAKIIEESGLVDYFTVNGGNIGTDHELAYHMPGMAAPLAPWLKMVEMFGKELRTPIIHACRINDLATARYAVENNVLDLVGMTRSHIADPYIVKKLEEDREEDIRPCVGAGYCLDRIYQGGEALCAHSVATGREDKVPHEVPKSTGPKKKIVVVGGGPGGMEAARVSAERGHDVVLFEANSSLGGQISLARKAGWRKDIGGIVDWYEFQLQKLNVDIRWNTYADGEMVKAEAPDVVFIASGGIPDTDYVPGGENALSVWDVLSGQELSGSILVYDDNGQHQAPSAADFLGQKDGTEVELVTPDRHAAMEMGTLSSPIYMEHFYANGVKVQADHRLKFVEKSGNKLKITFTNEFAGPEMERLVDHIVVEHGTLPLDEVFHELVPDSSNGGVTDYDALVDDEVQPNQGEGYQLFRIGDAVTSRNMHAAIYDAMRIAKDL